MAGTNEEGGSTSRNPGGQLNGKKAPRMDDTESRRIDAELRAYISDLPPNVDKLKVAAEKAVEESKELRKEARRTSSMSQTGMRRIEVKK